MPKTKEEYPLQQKTQQDHGLVEDLFWDEKDKQVLINSLVNKKKPGKKFVQATSKFLEPKLWRSLATYFHRSLP